MVMVRIDESTTDNVAQLRRWALEASRATKISPVHREALDRLSQGKEVHIQFAQGALFAVAITNATRFGQSMQRRRANDGVEALWYTLSVQAAVETVLAPNPVPTPNPRLVRDSAALNFLRGRIGAGTEAVLDAFEAGFDAAHN